jgi:DNA-binding HxlR family transcriptional regulator
MPHKKFPDGYCRIDKYLNLLSSKWTAHIVWLLSEHEQLRFGQIQKQLAFVSSKVLSQCLKNLELEEFIWRQEEATLPITVYYGLTQKGEALSDVVKYLESKSRDWDTKEWIRAI